MVTPLVSRPGSPRSAGSSRWGGRINGGGASSATTVASVEGDVNRDIRFRAGKADRWGPRTNPHPLGPRPPGRVPTTSAVQGMEQRLPESGISNQTEVRGVQRFGQVAKWGPDPERAPLLDRDETPAKVPVTLQSRGRPLTTIGRHPGLPPGRYPGGGEWGGLVES